MGIFGLCVLVVVVLMFSLLPGTVLSEGNPPASHRTSMLTRYERTALVKLMVNEKLARDVCEVMYQQWETCTFFRMFRTKKRDLGEIKEFLVSHMVPNPIKGYGAGSFPSQRVRELYKGMTLKGQRSLVDAIEVCSSIEKGNVKLISQCLKEVQDAKLRDLLKRLLAESQSHVRMFSGCLRNLGVAGSIHYPCL